MLTRLIVGEKSEKRSQIVRCHQLYNRDKKYPISSFIKFPKHNIHLITQNWEHYSNLSVGVSISKKNPAACFADLNCIFFKKKRKKKAKSKPKFISNYNPVLKAFQNQSKFLHTKTG